MAFGGGEVSPVTPLQVTTASGMCQMAAECRTPPHAHLWAPPVHAYEVKHFSGQLTCVIWQSLAHILKQGPWWGAGKPPNTTLAEVRHDRER